MNVTNVVQICKKINNTVVTNVSSGFTADMDFLLSAMLDDAQGQPGFDELVE